MEDPDYTFYRTTNKAKIIDIELIRKWNLLKIHKCYGGFSLKKPIYIKGETIRAFLNNEINFELDKQKIIFKCN